MAAKETLAEVLNELRSDKIKVRQKAIVRLRDIFSLPAAVKRMNSADQGEARFDSWLAVFHSLFVAYRLEVDACNKKGSDNAAGRRLADAASAIRWLVETAVESFQSKVVSQILSKLLAYLDQPQFFTIVSLDFSKAIRCIVAHKPHLVALKDEEWHALVGVAFNIVLGHSAQKELLTSEELGEHVSDDAMDEDPGPSGTNVAHPGASPRKRPRPDLSPRRATPTPGRPNVPGSSKSVTNQQVEFMSILAILLRSTRAPFLSPHDFPKNLLDYFSEFLRIYGADTSLHNDYLKALAGALPQLSLNRRQLLCEFSVNSWNGLLGLWGSKNQQLKEDLVIVLRMLFPYLTARPMDGESTCDVSRQIAKLWSVLNSDAESRWGVHGLSLDSLQLQLATSENDNQPLPPFVSRSFRYGWHFDSSQALAWAILELQADCAEKLYLYSESTYSTSPHPRKRVKIENPIAFLLNAISSPGSPVMRLYHQQVLLFFIDRHWHVLHDDMRKDVVLALAKLIALDDSQVQSWAFLCIAAITHSDNPSLKSFHSVTSWDSVWTHTMRRTHVPAVSRAACHTAHAFLLHSHGMLSPQCVLDEIEAFAKDLDAQGPTYPYDSVCDFIVLCLRLANQDARLYRMQMEEKVLAWLVAAWRIDDKRRTSMPLHTVGHLFSLLESITGSSKRVALVCGMRLPHSTIVEALLEDSRTRTIRDFQLHARIPRFHIASNRVGTSPQPASSKPRRAEDTIWNTPLDTIDLTPPRGRERRLSAFLLQSLEDITPSRDPTQKVSPLTLFKTAETARSAFDIAVLALTFEGSLRLNGTQPNRRVVQAACKLLVMVVDTLKDPDWTMDNRCLLLAGLDPLTVADPKDPQDTGWETLVAPGKATGIRSQALRRLLSNSDMDNNPGVAARRELQRVILNSTDVQSGFDAVLQALRELLKVVVTHPPEKKRQSTTIDIYGGNFSTANAAREWSLSPQIVRACVEALAVVPILLSQSGEPTHDRALAQLLEECREEQMLLLAPAYFEQVARGTLNVSGTTINTVMEELYYMIGDYAYKHHEETYVLLVQVLSSTLPVWMQDAFLSTEVGVQIRLACREVLSILQKRKVRRPWRVRDTIIRFLDKYLGRDPSQVVWKMSTPGDAGDEKPLHKEDLPASVLATLGDDDDVRIRFRVASVNARILGLGGRDEDDPVITYPQIWSILPSDPDNHDGVFTRLLCVGNVAIAQSEARSASYWHLLEVALVSQRFVTHQKAILLGVIERIGIATLADMFQCYASQIAYSSRQAGYDVLNCNPALLGYTDRRECAEAAFQALAPSNLLAGGEDKAVKHGQALFRTHCIAIQRSPDQAFHDCLADFVGYQVLYWLDDDPTSESDFVSLLASRAKWSEDELREGLARNTDGILVAMLRTLRDQDVSPNGTIITELRAAGLDAVAGTFTAITRYRVLDQYLTHEPNRPCYGTQTVLNGIHWFLRTIPHSDRPPISYHILHQLCAEIEQSPLINEQSRLSNALCLWIACHETHFVEGSLLRCLIHRAISMLSQADLARSAQSLLEWSLRLLRHMPKEGDRQVADILIQISRAAYDFSQEISDVVHVQLGADLFLWLEETAQKFYKQKDFKREVLKALAAWPRELPQELKALSEEETLSGLTSILRDPSNSVSKFRLVRRIRDLLSEGDNINDRLTSSDFWRLKACIPQQILVDDVDAFADLLVSRHGLLECLGSEDLASNTVRTRHRGVGQTLPGIPVAHSAIIVSLLAMLNNASASKVQVSYATLRTLVPIVLSDSDVPAQWPSHILQELEYMRVIPKPHDTRYDRDIHTLLDDTYSQITSDFRSWITALSVILCEVLAVHDIRYGPLTFIVRSDAEFAEELFPVLVHSLLETEASLGHDTRSRSTLSQYFAGVLASENADIACSKVIIDTVLHLRFFMPSNPPTGGQRGRDLLAYDKWLEMDYMLLSRCAIRCNAYTTALLFIELAREYNDAKFDDAGTEEILFELYSHIDEPDGFYGIQTSDLHGFLVQRLRHERQWDKAFRFHGAGLEADASSQSDNGGVVLALSAFGFNQMALRTLQNGSSDENASSGTLAYHLGWRTGTWDLPNHSGSEQASGASLYLALRAVFRERSQTTIDEIVQRSFEQELGRLRDLGNENFTEIRQACRNLMCLHQVRQWRSSVSQTIQRDGDARASEWSTFVRFDESFDFADLEAIMATRISLVQSVRQKEQRLGQQLGGIRTTSLQSLIDVEKNCLLSLSERARAFDQAQIAMNSVARAQQLVSDTSLDVSEEFANVLWTMKEPKLAVKSLNSLMLSVTAEMADDPHARLQVAMKLARLGTWCAEASLKKATQIVSECFGPATELIVGEPYVPQPSHALVFHQYAIFAEKQYHAISKSPDALRWKLYVERKVMEIRQRDGELRKMAAGTSQYQRANWDKTQAEKLLKEDLQRSSDYEGAKTTFLARAAEMYSLCLAASDAFDDDSAIRLCSLWLANFDNIGRTTEVDSAFDSAFSLVPSRKFVFLARQLTARLSGAAKTKDQTILQRLICTMCSEHPYHSLYPLYCLRVDPSAAVPSSSRRQSERHSSPSDRSSDRSSEAAQLFDRLRADPSRGERIANVENVCNASLEWAKHPIKKDQKKEKGRKSNTIPEELRIRKLKHIKVPVITSSTPLDSTKEYKDCVWIDRYEHKYTTAGGVNLPKISICYGSDGKGYKQLFKGEGADDLRQDAVMEQVFDLVNVVLRRDRDTRKRRLNIRGYTVIPLAAQAGVLEFVPNTTPLNDWIKPAHKRYQPRDIPWEEFMSRMSAEHKAQSGRHKDEAVVVALFVQLKARFQPVMRHYFTELYKNPISWFAMRLNYSRSVATTSIVGHVLGLGDRHTANILMDNHTGEVVHIDLGIAFEQGKLLPMPERVPFRLTPDMVDGLGASGTQGVFQRCAEETLRVLRDRSEVVLTVLEVFKYDPLHSWTASEIKMQQAQTSRDRAQTPRDTAQPTGEAFRYVIGLDMASGVADESADRALSSVSRKLEKTLSVEYTVNELIAEATDITNLAMMYSGWCAHL